MLLPAYAASASGKAYFDRVKWHIYRRDLRCMANRAVRFFGFMLGEEAECRRLRYQAVVAFYAAEHLARLSGYSGDQK